MPEGVKDRPARAHEHLFLLSKKESYFYDHLAVQVPTDDIRSKPRQFRKSGKGQVLRQDFGRPYEPRSNRDLRTVWTITPARCQVGNTHFAVFPQKLVEPCILAGSPKGATILDPFCGTGTVGAVARRLFREFQGIEINPEFAAFAEERIERQTAHYELFEENEDDRPSV
jgi:DNA modification methylase